MIARTCFANLNLEGGILREHEVRLLRISCDCPVRRDPFGGGPGSMPTGPDGCRHRPAPGRFLLGFIRGKLCVEAHMAQIGQSNRMPPGHVAARRVATFARSRRCSARSACPSLGDTFPARWD